MNNITLFDPRTFLYLQPEVIKNLKTAGFRRQRIVAQLIPRFHIWPNERPVGANRKDPLAQWAIDALEDGAIGVLVKGAHTLQHVQIIAHLIVRHLARFNADVDVARVGVYFNYYLVIIFPGVKFDLYKLKITWLATTVDFEIKPGNKILTV